MQSLPYELLQHIASSLLPRYQCRFALASRHNYKYLYTPLLKWHAKKQHIKSPRYKCLYKRVNHCPVSLVEFNKQLVLYKQTYYYGLYTYNLTYSHITSIDFNRRYRPMDNTPGILDMEGIMDLCDTLENTNILTGCYKYIHKIPLIMYLSSKHLLLSMPIEVLDNILYMLREDDRISFVMSSTYLRHVYNYCI